MVITIENPTAEAAYEALLQLPNEELNRLGDMIAQARYGQGYRSSGSAEDLKDAAASTARLIEKRFGAEEGDYD